MDRAVAIDKWYYIVDRSFYYYRVNEDSQLVMASSKDEADIFSYEDANNRIGNGKKSNFYFMMPTEEEAKEDEASSYDLTELDWKEYLKKFSYIASNVRRYHDNLSDQLSQVDQKICDILHYIEMYDLSEEENLYVVEQLKTYREQRRKIKDTMLITDTFARHVGTSNNIAKCKETIRAIDGLERRKYTPRQLPELFEGRALSVAPKIINFPKPASDSTWQKENEEEAMSESTERVERTWKETVFDDRKTDWRAFAIQQMEFFEQAKQYICNLELQLDEIDDQIYAILQEVEDANYNAVQGFQVFKRLKELRNTRKEVLRELDCVDALSARFCCDSMHDAYRECVEEIEGILA